MPDPIELSPPPPPEADKPWDWFAILLLAGVFANVGYALVMRILSPSDVTFILGIMLGWIGSIVGYRWGSSVGSKNKDAVIASLSK